MTDTMTDTERQLRSQCDSIAAEIDAMDAATRAWIESDNDDESPAAQFLADALEVYAEGRYSLNVGEWFVARWGVLVALGGPGIRVVVEGSGSCTIEGRWWGDSYDACATSQHLASELDSLADAYSLG